jgi:hypothetical protein
MIHTWIKRLFKKKQYVQLECLQLECLGDRLVITDGDGKLIAEYVLKEMRIEDMKINDKFKCPNSNLHDWEERVVCDIGYACDACPYNPDLRENYKGVKVSYNNTYTQ